MAEKEHDQILPVYILVDVSYSMSGEPIKAANEIVPALIDACLKYNTLADILRFSLVSFSDAAKTLVPMSKYDEALVPSLMVEGGTQYGLGFTEIKERIDIDIASLNSDGYTVFRPSVFFITDGDPTDDTQVRRAAWDDLTDKNRRSHPNVLAFGVGSKVTGASIKEYVSHKGRAFVSKSGADAASSLRSIIEMLVMSVVASANDAATGDMGGIVLNTAAIDEDMSEVV